MTKRLWVLWPLLALTACAGERTVSCQSNVTYRSASSIPPLRIPDDLSVPDESDAVRVPPRPASSAEAAEPGRCLELPPDFFESRGA